jgi:hypothetical protein
MESTTFTNPSALFAQKTYIKTTCSWKLLPRNKALGAVMLCSIFSYLEEMRRSFAVDGSCIHQAAALTTSEKATDKEPRRIMAVALY